MHICIIEADRPGEDLESRFGDYADMFEAWLGRALPEARFSRVHVAAGEALPDPATVDGLLVTGSRSSAYDPDPWIATLKDYLRDARDAGRPIGGVCFGHQVMAEAFGGRVERAPGGWVLGRHAHALTDRGRAVFGPHAGLNVLSIHQDQVVSLPPGAEVALATPASAHGGIAYPFRALSVQFHPEFPEGFLQALIDTGLGVRLPDALLAQAQETLDGPLDTAIVAEAFARLYRGPLADAPTTQVPAGAAPEGGAS